MSEDVAAGTTTGSPVSAPPEEPTRPIATASRVRARLARFGGPRTDVDKPGAGAAVAHRPGDAPQGRPVGHRAGLRRGRARPPGPVAPQRRSLHHPSGRRRDHRRRAGHLRHATLAAALLHDTVEDTGYTLDRAAGDFGDEVAMLVDGVTKLDKLSYGDAAQAETVRKMVVAMAKDIRVLVIKLADRLHNARTLALRAAGVGAAQGPGDPGDLRAAGPPPGHEHDQVGAGGPRPSRPCTPRSTTRSSTWSPTAPRSARSTSRGVRDAVKADLTRGQDQGRRSPAGRSTTTPIYQKMIVRGRDFDEIYDLVGVRVLVDTVRDCYAVLGAHPRALEADSRAVQGLHRDARSSTCTSRCTPP